MRALLPLGLEGEGTHAVEALPSYITRLAAAHGVTVGGLFRHLVLEFVDEASLVAAIAAQPLAASVRPNGTTERIVSLLAAAGCSSEISLRRATFLHLASALARTPGAYSKRIRWCPACLHEQEISSGRPYLKLSWFFDGIKTCELHRVVLRDVCPHCHRRPGNSPWWPNFGRCHRCEERLDMLHATDQIEHDSQAYGPDLVSLVEDLAGRYEPYPAGAVNTYVDRVFEIAWANELEDALWRMLPRDECLRYASPEEPISLAVARRIAFRLEVPLAELLSAREGLINTL